MMRRDRVFRKVLAEEGYEATLGAIHAAYVTADSWWLTAYGNKVMTRAETAEAYRDLDEKVFSATCPQQSHAEAVRVSRQVRKRWPELEDEIPPELYPDAEPTLGRLKREGYSLGLVSNAPAEATETVAALGLSKYLDSVTVSGVVGYSKPNPEIFRIALKALSVGPEEAVHVGDLYEADVRGARNAGIEGVLLDRDGSYGGTECPKIDTLSGIYGFLE